jgi:predicted amidohydrolase
MKIHALIAQFPISLSIEKNLETMLAILEQSQPEDLILFPEGAVSGYSHDLSFLNNIDLQELDAALKQLQLAAARYQIHLWVGSLNSQSGLWFNRAYSFNPQGDLHTYDKINLAHHERGILAPGNKLPVFAVNTEHGTLRIGVQLCREIRYPEQWGWLARQGAQIILHLNNAINNSSQSMVWRSHLISRAAETQCFVLSANNAAPGQLCPTMAVAPDGEILSEIISPKQAQMRLELDLSRVSNWYLSQCREDIVRISPSQ